MKRLEKMLYNAIIMLLEENQTEYDGLEDELFINKVCTSIGLTEAEYRKLMIEEEQ